METINNPRDTVLAESSNTNDAIQNKFVHKSDLHTTCPWKGQARYYDVVVNGKSYSGAAWYYPEPKDAAKKITGYVAFWKGVVVQN